MKIAILIELKSDFVLDFFFSFFYCSVFSSVESRMLISFYNYDYQTSYFPIKYASMDLKRGKARVDPML